MRSTIGTTAIPYAAAVCCIHLNAIAHEPGPHEPGAASDDTPSLVRFVSNRAGRKLELPQEEDAFFFIVFGDRTGGPAEGVRVLADAVRDTNLLGPDFVMTVGDLVEGYNERPQWLAQMREYTSIMDELRCPWFPVAGNHDIYWRGEHRPEEEHEGDYEKYFGPLWYAFEHKDAWFIALYSDEGDPETGERNFQKPNCQRMSDAQFNWLAETLERASDATHVFLFLHHPRWLGGNYGDDWDRVHELLVTAGNVTAVFAGHIHRMRYDGPKDGIEYVTLATVGGGQTHHVPEAGYLHHFHIVTVRDDTVHLASVPVGEVMDVRAITGAVSNETARIAHIRPNVDEFPQLQSDGAMDHMIETTIVNPVSRPIDVVLGLESDDSRWWSEPSHRHLQIKPNESASLSFRLRRQPSELDDTFRSASFRLDMDYLADGARFTIPTIEQEIPMHIDLPVPPTPDGESVLVLDGLGDALILDDAFVHAPDGPLTLECWFNAHLFSERTGLITKTENSEFGLFVNHGRPEFYIHIGGSYVRAAADKPILETNRWHHIAGVFDGSETRLYVDGRLIDAVKRSGARRTNRLPFIVGADVDGNGRPVSHFWGMIDGVHLSTTVRYQGDSFTPQRRPGADEHSSLLLNMDGGRVRWIFDESEYSAHPTRRGDAQLKSLND